MPRNRLVNFRLTEQQYKLLKNRMEVEGYNSISHYIRDSTLRDDLSSIKLLRKIHGMLMEEKENERNEMERNGTTESKIGG